MPEKQWIFDTVSLSNFLLSDSVFLLEKRYKKRGIIAGEVYNELSSGMAAYPKLREIDRLIEGRTFRLLSLSDAERKCFIELIGHLGKGEAACIAMAENRSAIVVTDDRTARKQCAERNIPATGTIGILKASVQDATIAREKADEILSKMTSAGFYSPVGNISDIV